MRVQGSRLADYVILPEVVAALTYILLVRVLNIYQCCTLHFPEEMTDTFRLLPTGLYATLTTVNVAFAAAFGFAFLRVRRSHPNVRKGHYAGLIASAITLLYLQVALNAWHQPLLSLLQGGGR